MQQRFETFTILINRISRNIRKIKNQEMAEYDLRSIHVSCIYYLYGMPCLTATDLCEHCGEDKASISRALEYLETNGYLTCEVSGAKRYKSRFTLTEKGQQVGRQIAEKIDRVFAQVGAVLTEEEREIFYSALTRISKGLDQLSERGMK